jgi:hypothetical protein
MFSYLVPEVGGCTWDRREMTTMLVDEGRGAAIPTGPAFATWPSTDTAEREVPVAPDRDGKMANTVDVFAPRAVVVADHLESVATTQSTHRHQLAQAMGPGPVVVKGRCHICHRIATGWHTTLI